MKVFIKNKFFSIGGDSEVYNEEKKPIYKIDGKFFSWTKKKKMYDMEGNLLYVIRNRFWNFFTNKVFIYNPQKEKVATIKKNKWSFNFKYQILDTPDEMSIEGKFFRRNSTILKNGEPFATITNEITLINDAFTLEADEKDMPFCTALVIAFDNIKDKRQNDND